MIEGEIENFLFVLLEDKNGGQGNIIEIHTYFPVILIYYVTKITNVLTEKFPK